MGTKSLFWGDIPGMDGLLGDCPNLSGVLDNPRDMLDAFILRDDPRNPTDISCYVSRMRGLVLVFYQRDSEDTIRFMQVIPDSEHNRKYVIYELSKWGAPAGMSPDYACPRNLGETE